MCLRKDFHLSNHLPSLLSLSLLLKKAQSINPVPPCSNSCLNPRWNRLKPLSPPPRNQVERPPPPRPESRGQRVEKVSGLRYWMYPPARSSLCPLRHPNPLYFPLHHQGCHHPKDLPGN